MRTTRRARFHFLVPSLALLACVIGPGLASAAMIDFETLPGSTPEDGIEIDAQYLAGYWMAFGLDTDGDGIADAGAMPLLERSGRDAGWAFVNDADGSYETAIPGYENELGGWMLGLPTHAQGTSLLVRYAAPMQAAGADIWDIDGNEMQGTEQWRIDALAFDGSVLASILSPVGDSLDADSLNAKPWSFGFERATTDIWGLRLEFVGSKTWGMGVGFDHFWCAVPEPGTLAMLAIGVVALGARRRR